MVQGEVDLDEYEIFKPLLSELSLSPIIGRKFDGKSLKMICTTDNEQPTENVPIPKVERAASVLSDHGILALSRQTCVIGQHYNQPMDIKWTKDGLTGEMFVVRVRPETVESRRETSVIRAWHIKKVGRKMLSDASIGKAIAAGRVYIIENPSDVKRLIDDIILVTQTMDPDWVPIMRRAVVIITNQGGRTSYVAIVSRELGLPAIADAGSAMYLLHDEQEIAVSRAKGREELVYKGVADSAVGEIDSGNIPAIRARVMLNLANPAAVFRWQRIPADGVELARMKLVTNDHVKIRPMALVRFDTLKGEDAKQIIVTLTTGYKDRTGYSVNHFAHGLGRIVAVQYPYPATVRMSDFKTNEYAHLIGDTESEPKEDNPMLGFRGAPRYYSPCYREGFAPECRAIRRLRNEMGFTNVVAMIPFCRSTKEADHVPEVMADNGIYRGEVGLQVCVICEIPSNVILARVFTQRFDGFSIGSSDLTQPTLDVDRDSVDLAAFFDEQDDAVRWMIHSVIASAYETGAHVGPCGWAPSDHPELITSLVERDIGSISVSPGDSVAVKRSAAAVESTAAKAP